MAKPAAATAKRPGSKGKDKKAQRKLELEHYKQKEALVKAAVADEGLLQPFTPFRRFDRKGVQADVRCCTAAQLSQEQAAWAFQLVKTNMQAFYEAAEGMGWSDSKKRAQLTAEEARFLLVTGKVEGSSEEQPLAYSHFRFEMEENVPVLYCWELHVEEVAKRRGMGRFLMQLLELLARRAGMERVMLTVMSKNADAFALYNSLGYTMDDSSPSACDAADDCGYEILSKALPPQRKQEVPQQPAAAAAAAATTSKAAGGAAAAGRQPMTPLTVN